MICIYMSDERVKLIEGAVSGNKILVKKFSDIETNCAAVESGGLKDMVAFTQTVQEYMQTNAVKPQDVHYVIDNSRVVFREMVMPDVPETKIKQMIAAEIFSDSRTQNNTLDFVVESSFKNEEKKPRVNVVVTYLSNDVIEAIHISGTELGLKPTVLDVAPNAMGKLIGGYASKYKKLFDEDTFLLLDYKDTFITLSIFDNFKRKFSKSTVLYLTDSTTIDAAELIVELSKNINSIVRFYESRNEEKQIKAVYITGNVSVVSDHLQELANAVSMKVSVLPLPGFVSGMSLMDFNTFSCALGAMLRR